MSNNISPILGVGVMLINPAGQVLLGQRIKAGEAPSWCFPGGKMDRGESFAQACCRELFEETALLIEPSRMQALCVMSNSAGSACNSTIGMRATIQHAEISQIKVTEPHLFATWQWFDLQLLPMPLFAETEVMLRFYLGQALSENWSVYGLVDSDHA